MKNNLEDEIDNLFTLPLADFTAVRNALAAQLKKEKQADQAARVKSLAKPPISAWAVNQLYWQHRDEFDELIATGEHVRKAQSSGKVAAMQAALDARRKILTQLSEFASALLEEAGSNPSLETLRRINTTLEALSAYSTLPEDATLGRLTKDIDPPGFDFLSGAGSPGVKVQSPQTKPSSTKSHVSSAKNKRQSANEKAQGVTDSRQAMLAAAKSSLQDAKLLLSEARNRAETLEGKQKKADAAVKEAEEQKRDAERALRGAKERLRQAEQALHAAEVRLQRTTATAENATEHARAVNDSLKDATKTLNDATRGVDKHTKELEKLFRSAK